jgi:tetratricopeptide (TPR) repeat protein
MPLLLGCFGAVWHARRDPWRFVSMAVLFVLTGIGLAVYLNMPDPQPRERDYVFVGSFIVFAVWIGMGARQAILWASSRGKAFAQVVAVASVCLPLGLAWASHGDHDRSNNWIAHDYAYNMLASCEPDALLFTNGDNDTFPLWFLQEVVGFRKDVRVLNLSLLNTSWYIKQLRDNAPTLPVNYTDSYIDDVLTAYTREAILRSNRLWREDRAVSAAGMTWTIPAASIGILRVQDVMILKLVDWVNWQRPIYFGTTVPDNNLIGLRDHLEMDGMVYRLKPEKADVVNIEKTRRHLFEVYQYRGITDPGVALEENALELLVNYHVAFLQLSEMLRVAGRMDEAFEVVQKCEEVALSPKSWNGALLLAGSMGRLDQTEEVLRLVQVALDVDAFDRPMQYASAAQTLLNYNLHTEAIGLYTRMLDEGLNVEIALYNRAVAFESVGDTEAAKRDLLTLDLLVPGAPEVKEGLELLQRKIDAQSGGRP